LTQVAIIGAGPYGLSAAAYLRAAGLSTHVFGETMGFWQHQMPEGMFLRSYWTASHIGDPENALSLDAYQIERGEEVPRPIPLDNYIDYGRWFGKRVVPDVDGRAVERLERDRDGFRLTIEGGDSVRAERVVVAAGIAPFARRPVEFADLPRELASHSSAHGDFVAFEGKSVTVVGGGQSALESAALLHEAGATVQVLVRAPSVHWLRYGSDSKFHAALHGPKNPFRSIMFPPSDVGPPGINMLVDNPPLWRMVPTQGLRDRMSRRAIRPAGAGWLPPRLREVEIRTGVTVISAQPSGSQLDLSLSDGTSHRVDHVLLATGYEVDVARYAFMNPGLLGGLRVIDGHPRLDSGFESSVPGLHFIGAPAAKSFGPLVRFVAGTAFVSRRLAKAIFAATPRRAGVVEFGSAEP
jgi:cation diffusion facilitator CzcD-associated flavoprotein CzcO